MPFLEADVAQRAKSDAIGTGRPYKICRHNVAIGTPPEAAIRYCPQCVLADVQQFGYVVWRCLHQIGPLEICPLHHCRLIATNVRCWTGDYDAPSVALAEGAQSSCNPPSRLQLALANNISGLVANPHWGVGCARLIEGCRIELRRSGRTILGRSALIAFETELAGAFGDDYLQMTKSFTRHGSPNWPSAIFLGTRVRPQIQHYCAVCAILGIPLVDLIAKAAVLGESDLGPWPCMSQGQSCSSKATINRKYNCSGKWNHKGDRYRFQCPRCGTIYFRPAPLTRNEDGGFVFEFSHKNLPAAAWAAPLRELWLDSTQNWRSLVGRFGKSPSQIAYSAAKLGLPDVPGRSLRFYRELFRQRTEKRTLLIEQRRTTLMEFLAAHSAINKKKAPRKIRKLHDWLRLNAPGPHPSFAPTSRASNLLHRRPKLVNVDDDVAELVRSKLVDSDQALRRLTERRITTTFILRFLAPTIKIPLYSLKRMPITRAAILKYVETDEQRRARRVARIIRIIEQSQGSRSWISFYNQYNMRLLQPEIRARIRSAYERTIAIC